jgi:DNA-binding NarL/FixJ family response regulator
VIRILVADDHDVVRRGVREMLAGHPGWEVCGEAASGREAMERAAALRPDVVVLDLSLPDLYGLEVARRIRAELPGTEVLVFTMHDSDELLAEVLAAGARGYVLKSDAAKDLLAGVEALAEHLPYFSPPVAERLVSGYLRGGRGTLPEPQGADPLTTRERTVVQLLAEGKSHKEIAAALAISARTVETHRANAMRKLGAGSIADVVRYAVRARLVEP